MCGGGGGLPSRGGFDPWGCGPSEDQRRGSTGHPRAAAVWQPAGAAQQDSLAEWSKALASGASPQGRGFEPHSCHICSLGEAQVAEPSLLVCLRRAAFGRHIARRAGAALRRC